MPKLHVRCTLKINHPSLGEGMKGFGPIFQGWCPATENDAIEIPTPEPGVTVRVWFKTKVKKRARKTEVFWSGPLMGQMDGLDVSVEEASALRSGSEYRGVGKRVAILLNSAITTLVDALRGDYGQYWVPRLRQWDSRYETLGDFCARWQMEWSLDHEGVWLGFVPEDKGDEFPGPARTRELYHTPHEGEYITKADWAGLSKSLSGGHKPSLGSAILSQAHGHCDQGNLRLAFLEGVSALEIAIGDYLTNGADGPTKQLLQQFFDISLAAQVSTISSAGGPVPKELLGQTVAAIKIRNSVAHEGFDPSSSNLPELKALLMTVSHLLKRPSHKFPRVRRTLLSGGAPEW